MDTQQYPNSFGANPQCSWLQEHDRHVLTQFLSVGVVLPEQFQEVPIGPRRQGPEARLLYAVLEDALWCFQQQFLPRYGNERRLAREAEIWFFSNTSDWPFSFVRICDVLGLEPEYLRRGLRQWYQQRPVIFQRSKRRATSSQRPLVWRAATHERPPSSGAANSRHIHSRLLREGRSDNE
jgi:hypothetical protein